MNTPRPDDVSSSTATLPHDRTRAGSTAPLPAPASPATTPTCPDGIGAAAAAAPCFFGPFELLEEIDRGGMGIVYRARDTHLDRFVALKMILAGRAAQREEIVRFHREARAAGGLDHRHIIPILEAGALDGQPYFAMPLARGGSLSAHVARFGADPRRAAALVEKIARAVHHAHAHGILHRDLKPANVLLDADDEPWVADFGLAKFLNEEEQTLTRSGKGLGTPAYMAPEQADPHRGPFTERSDVWALGVILYELLAGRRPFRGRRETVLIRILTEEPVRLCRLRQGLDRELEAIVEKCLHKAPKDRYVSAEALADDLRAWLDSRSPTVRPAGAAKRAWRRVRRRPALVLLGLSWVFLLAVILASKPSGAGVPPPTDDQVLAQQRDDWQAKREIVLIGETGMPRWHAFPLTSWRAALHGAPDEALKVGAGGRALVELMPSVFGDRYRVEAEVLHEPDAEGEVGLYVGREGVATGDDVVDHFLCRFGFTNVGPQRGTASLSRCRYREPGRMPGVFLDARALTLAPDPPGAAPDFRQIALEVSPEEIVLFWEGRLVGRISSVDLAEKTDVLLSEEWNGPPPRFNPRGGLGLFAETAHARFRRVVVRPAPEP